VAWAAGGRLSLGPQLHLAELEREVLGQWQLTQKIMAASPGSSSMTWRRGVPGAVLWEASFGRRRRKSRTW
jgi:hypothetical protein